MRSKSNRSIPLIDPKTCDVLDFVNSLVHHGGTAQDVCANMDLDETELAATRTIHWEKVGGAGSITQMLGDNRTGT